MKILIIVTFLFIQMAVTGQIKTDLNVYESLEYEEKVKTDSIRSIYTSELGNTAIIRSNKREIFFDVFDDKLIKKH